MIPRNHSLKSPLCAMLGPSPLSEDELAELRRQAWWEQGLLIAHPWDIRLSPVEARALNQIAERLYGGTKP